MSRGVTKPCGRWSGILWQEVDGSLSGPARHELERHLEACAGCSAALEAVRELDRALAAGALAFPRPGFEERVLLGIAAGATGDPIASRGGRRRGRTRDEAGDWWVLCGGMAAAAFVGLGAVAILPPLLLRATSAAAVPGAPSVWADLASQMTRLMLGPGGGGTGILNSPLTLACGGMAAVLLVSLGLLRFALTRPAVH